MINMSSSRGALVPPSWMSKLFRHAVQQQSMGAGTKMAVPTEEGGYRPKTKSKLSRHLHSTVKGWRCSDAVSQIVPPVSEAPKTCLSSLVGTQKFFDEAESSTNEETAALYGRPEHSVARGPHPPLSGPPERSCLLYQSFPLPQFSYQSTILETIKDGLHNLPLHRITAI